MLTAFLGLSMVLGGGTSVAALDLKLLPQQGHSRKSYALATHPNGRWVASSENDIRIWDIYSRRLLRVFKDFNHTQLIMEFSNNPESNLMLSTGPDDTEVHLWDIEQGRRIKSFNLGSGFTPSSITWIGGKDEEPTQFFVMGYKEYRKFDVRKDSYIYSSSINDEHLDGTADNSADEYGLFDLDLAIKGGRLHLLPEINSFLLRKYDTLIIASLDNRRQDEYKTIVLGSHLYNVDYNAKRNLLALATNDDFQLYDLNDHKLLFQKKNLWDAWEHNIRISENGKYLFLDYMDSSAVIEWETGKELLRLTPTVQIAEFTHNDEYLIVGGWASPYVFNLKTGTNQAMTIFAPSISGIEMHKNRWLELQTSAGQNDDPVYFDLRKLEFKSKIDLPDTAFTAYWDNALNQFSIYRGKDLVNQFKVDFKINGVSISKIPETEQKVQSPVVSADGKYLYVIEMIADPRTAKRQKKRNEKLGYVSLPTNGYRRRMAKYDCATGKRLATSSAFKDWTAYTIKTTSDSKLIISNNEEVYVHDANSLKRLGNLTPEQPDNWLFFVRGVKHLPTQKLIMVFQEWKLHFWSTETFKEVKTISIDARYSTGMDVFGDSVLVIAGSEGKHDLMLVHLPSLELINWVQTSIQVIKDVRVIDDCVVILYRDGSLNFWHIRTWQSIANGIIDANNKEFAIYKNDGRYYGTKEILKYLTMTNGLASYSVSQFDHQFNKPHEVLQELSFVDPEKVKMLKRLHDKRLQQYQKLKAVDLKSAPSLEISNLPFETQNSTIWVRIKAKSSNSKLLRLEAWANGVPVYGRKGLALKGNSSELDTTIRFHLLTGTNELKWSVKDAEARQSTIEKRLVNCSASQGKDSLIVICIATSKYINKSYNLRYAVKDGRDIVQTISSINYKKYTGMVNYTASKYHLKVDTLFDEDVNRDNFYRLAERIKNCRPQDKVIISMSGHGLLDDQLNWWFATHQMDFEKPGKHGISYEMIMELMEQSPSRHKLLMLDACHSGELDRSTQVTDENEEIAGGVELVSQFKGAKVSRLKNQDSLNSYDLMKEYFLDMNQLTGVHVISAASGDSYALESDRWQNGVFTYCFLKAIKGEDHDLMKKGLSITELQQYISQEVQRLTKGKQKPMTRGGNPEHDYNIWW